MLTSWNFNWKAYTLEEVSCKVNEYSVSENTLYRFVDGFNEDRISIF